MQQYTLLDYTTYMYHLSQQSTPTLFHLQQHPFLLHQELSTEHISKNITLLYQST